MKTFAFALALAFSAMAQPAAAAVIHDLDGVARNMPAANQWATTPQQFGGDVTFTAHDPTNGQAGAYYGYTGQFIFKDTVWSGTPGAMVGYQSAVMSFSFGDPVSAFLAELAVGSINGSTLALSAYNASGKLLETVSFSAEDFASGFYGLQRAANDISRIDVSGYYFGVRNIETLTSVTSAVPEPATWAMMIVGFGGAGVLIRRSRRSLAPQIA